MPYESPLTPLQFNQAAYNLGLPVRWECAETTCITEKNLRGWDSFSKAGFVEEEPNEFLTKLFSNIEWYIHSGHHYQDSLRDIESLDQRVQATKASYQRDFSAEMRESYRQALRDRDLATRTWAEIEIDFSHLPEPDQRVIRILIEKAVPAVERIYITQMDPQNLRYLEEIIDRGEAADLYAFRHMGGIACLSEGMDTLASAHPDSPEPTSNQGLWPANMTESDIKKVLLAPPSQVPNVAALGSSFVYRMYAEGGEESERGLVARSINSYPPIAHDLKKLIAVLREAAAVDGINHTIARFLETRANEFLDGQNPFPFFGGDADWINIRGAWDMTLGFYEEQDSPANTVAIMEMFLGVVDVEREKQGESFRALLPWMEDEIARNLGPDYKRRNFEELVPLRFINALHGGNSQARYVPAAFNLPNIPPYGRRDLTKKVFLLKASEARFRDVIFPMAQLTIDPEQLARINIDDALSFIVGHENAHAAGPGHSYVVRQENGENIITHALLKEHYLPSEESRADLLGITSLPEAVRRGIINQDGAEKSAISFLASLNRGLALGEEDSHGQGAFMEFTTLFEMGAIVETADGKFKANFKDGLFFTACTELGHRLNKIQMEGDYEAIDQWYKRSVANLPERMKTYLPQLRKMPRDIFPAYHFKFSI